MVPEMIRVHQVVVPQHATHSNSSLSLPLTYKAAYVLEVFRKFNWRVLLYLFTQLEILKMCSTLYAPVYILLPLP